MYDVLVILDERAKNIEISVKTVIDGGWLVVAYQQGPMGLFYLAIFEPVEARYVRVTSRDANNYMHFCEV